MRAAQARRTAAEGSATRDRLLDATGAVMARRNSADVSLQEIAEEAGVNAALVKYYFGNKQGLLTALLERDTAASFRDLDRLLRSTKTPTEKLRLHIAGFIRTYLRYPYINRLFRAILGGPDDDGAREIARFFVKPLTEFYRTLLDEGVRAGEFRPADPMLFYFSLVGVCDHLFDAHYALRYAYGIERVTPELAERYIGHVTAVMMGGMLAR